MVCSKLIRCIKHILNVSLKIVTTHVDPWQRTLKLSGIVCLWREAMGKQFAQLLQSYIDGSGIKRTHVPPVSGISYNYLTRLLRRTRRPSYQLGSVPSQSLHLSADQTV